MFCGCLPLKDRFDNRPGSKKARRQNVRRGSEGTVCSALRSVSLSQGFDGKVGGLEMSQHVQH